MLLKSSILTTYFCTPLQVCIWSLLQKTNKQINKTIPFSENLCSKNSKTCHAVCFHVQRKTHFATFFCLHMCTLSYLTGLPSRVKSSCECRAVASLTVPGGQEFHFPQISINFSNFSSNLIYFLPHFGPPGGEVAHLGRPWLHHCVNAVQLYLHFWQNLVFCCFWEYW